MPRQHDALPDELPPPPPPPLLDDPPFPLEEPWLPELDDPPLLPLPLPLLLPVLPPDPVEGSELLPLHATSIDASATCDMTTPNENDFMTKSSKTK